MCGIFGIISESKIPFNYGAFCTLGIHNDSRGGDSCGIFIDGSVEYGVNKEKLFNDFYQDSELLNSTTSVSIAVGHCRKASVGKVDIKTAQPVVIYKDDRAEFVVLHNGTIYNYKELAEKYIPGIDITGMTDSQVMTQIFYHTGYDVLGEYNGGSVFAIIDYREDKPKIFFFQGESAKTKNAAIKTEERPLFFCIKDGVLMFSSIDTFLPVFNKDCDILTPVCNKLIKFENGDVYVEKEIDRSKCCQERPIITIGATYDYDDYYGYWNKSQLTTYLGILTYCVFNNTYKLNNKTMDGPYFITSYGYVYQELPEHVDAKLYWFFNGIPFDKKEYYQFVFSAYLKTKKSKESFVQNNEKLIRFLSRDRLITINGITYLIEGPGYLKLFDGKFTPIGSSRAKSFQNGKSVGIQNEFGCGICIPPKIKVNTSTLKKLWNL